MTIGIHSCRTLDAQERKNADQFYSEFHSIRHHKSMYQATHNVHFDTQAGRSLHMKDSSDVSNSGVCLFVCLLTFTAVRPSPSSVTQTCPMYSAGSIYTFLLTFNCREEIELNLA